MENTLVQQRPPALGTKLVLGIFLTLLGVFNTLDNLNLIDSEPILAYWPLMLVAIGALKLRDRASRGVGLLTMGVGLFLLSVAVRWVSFSIASFWPVILIATGLLMVLRSFGISLPTGQFGSGRTMLSILNNRKVTLAPRALDGQSVIAFMGGTLIELTDESNGEPAEAPVVIEVLEMWSGIEIRVPAGWEVICEALPMMGGIDIRTGPASGGRRLIVRGLVLMGAMVIKNVKVVTQ